MALEFYRPPDVFDARIELNFEVESHQALLFPLRRLTADLAAYLAGRDSGVQRFVLQLEHRDLADSQVVVGLLAAEREAGMLFELTRGRLNSCNCRTGAGSAIAGARAAGLHPATPPAVR